LSGSRSETGLEISQTTHLLGDIARVRCGPD
jgi:hypothetical protein